MVVEKEKKLLELSKKLGVEFSDLSLLKQALTHRSYLGEVDSASSNERLEFLGDAVLGLVVSDYLHREYSDRTEGELAKAKAVAVSEPILAQAAKDLGIDQAIYLSTGEETSGGRERLSILSDTFEAVVAAIYIDVGLDAAQRFILNALDQILTDIERGEHIRDYKSLLQELTQSVHKRAPQYVVVWEEGADHDKTFVVEARLNDSVLGTGTGKSKKQAEQAAALEALEKSVEKLQNHRQEGE